MELIDVLDAKGNKTGEKTTLDDACNRGLWHNSVHAIIITQDHKIIAQKRSHTILMNPDLMELSVGGAVNSGEDCMRAIIRETKEELGINVNSSEVVYINTKKYKKHYAKLHKTSDTFLYTYVIKLKKPIHHTKLQISETSRLYILSLKKAKRLVRYHRIARLGKITPFYEYWKFSLEQAEKFIYPTIHFVCRGNIFRSRLAREYLTDTSKKVKVVSSGIWAKQALYGSISRHAKALMHDHGLKNHQRGWVQTTQRNIDDSTLVIFMSETIFQDASKMFDLSSTKYLVWDIADIKRSKQATSIDDGEKIYQKIVDRIEELKKSELYKNIIR